MGCPPRNHHPGPFGDIDQLERLLQWIEQYGVDNCIDVSHRISVGEQGYGRPEEHAERGD
jgi:hypothetical protein